jgi:HEAT repeat protein
MSRGKTMRKSKAAPSPGDALEKEKARECRKIDRLLTNLTYCDRWNLPLLRRQREHAVPILSTLLADPEPNRRVWAAVMLSDLGEPSGPAAIAEYLRDERCRQALLLASLLFDTDLIRGPSKLVQRMVADHPNFGPWFHASLRSSDREVLAASIDLALALDREEYAEQLCVLATSGETDPQGKAFLIRARRCPLESVDLFIARLGSAAAAERVRLRTYFREFRGLPKEDLARLAQVAFDEIRGLPGDGHCVTGVDSAAELIGAVPRVGAQMLARLMSDDVSISVRRPVIEALARVDPVTALPHALPHLKHPMLGYSAIDALKTIGAAARKPQVFAALKNLIEESEWDYPPPHVFEVLRAIGGSEAIELATLMAKRPTVPELEEHIRPKMIVPTEFIARMAELGILSAEEAARADRPAKKPTRKSALRAVYTALADAGRVARGVEGAEVSHDEVLKKLSQASLGAFKARAIVTETLGGVPCDEKKPCRIEFDNGAEVIRLKADRYPSFLSLVDAANTNLRRTRHPRRFVVVQERAVLFALFVPPDEFRILAREWGIRILESAGDAPQRDD